MKIEEFLPKCEALYEGQKYSDLADLADIFLKLYKQDLSVEPGLSAEGLKCVYYGLIAYIHLEDSDNLLERMTLILGILEKGLRTEENLKRLSKDILPLLSSVFKDCYLTLIRLGANGWRDAWLEIQRHYALFSFVYKTSFEGQIGLNGYTLAPHFSFVASVANIPDKNQIQSVIRVFEILESSLLKQEEKDRSLKTVEPVSVAATFASGFVALERLGKMGVDDSWSHIQRFFPLFWFEYLAELSLSDGAVDHILSSFSVFGRSISELPSSKMLPHLENILADLQTKFKIGSVIPKNSVHNLAIVLSNCCGALWILGFNGQNGAWTVLTRFFPYYLFLYEVILSKEVGLNETTLGPFLQFVAVVAVVGVVGKYPTLTQLQSISKILEILDMELVSIRTYGKISNSFLTKIAETYIYTFQALQKIGISGNDEAWMVIQRYFPSYLSMYKLDLYELGGFKEGVLSPIQIFGLSITEYPEESQVENINHALDILNKELLTQEKVDMFADPLLAQIASTFYNLFQALQKLGLGGHGKAWILIQSHFPQYLSVYKKLMSKRLGLTDITISPINLFANSTTKVQERIEVRILVEVLNVLLADSKPMEIKKTLSKDELLGLTDTLHNYFGLLYSLGNNGEIEAWRWIQVYFPHYMHLYESLLYKYVGVTEAAMTPMLAYGASVAKFHGRDENIYISVILNLLESASYKKETIENFKQKDIIAFAHTYAKCFYGLAALGARGHNHVYGTIKRHFPQWWFAFKRIISRYIGFADTTLAPIDIFMLSHVAVYDKSDRSNVFIDPVLDFIFVKSKHIKIFDDALTRLFNILYKSFRYYEEHQISIGLLRLALLHVNARIIEDKLFSTKFRLRQYRQVHLICISGQSLNSSYKFALLKEYHHVLILWEEIAMTNEDFDFLFKVKHEILFVKRLKRWILQRGSLPTENPLQDDLVKDFQSHTGDRVWDSLNPIAQEYAWLYSSVFLDELYLHAQRNDGAPKVKLLESLVATERLLCSGDPSKTGEFARSLDAFGYFYSLIDSFQNSGYLREAIYLAEIPKARVLTNLFVQHPIDTRKVYFTEWRTPKESISFGETEPQKNSEYDEYDKEVLQDKEVLPIDIVGKVRERLPNGKGLLQLHLSHRDELKAFIVDADYIKCLELSSQWTSYKVFLSLLESPLNEMEGTVMDLNWLLLKRTDFLTPAAWLGLKKRLIYEYGLSITPLENYINQDKPDHSSVEEKDLQHTLTKFRFLLTREELETQIKTEEDHSIEDSTQKMEDSFSRLINPERVKAIYCGEQELYDRAQQLCTALCNELDESKVDISEYWSQLKRLNDEVFVWLWDRLKNTQPQSVMDWKELGQIFGMVSLIQHLGQHILSEYLDEFPTSDKKLFDEDEAIKASQGLIKEWQESLTFLEGTTVGNGSSENELMHSVASLLDTEIKADQAVLESDLEKYVSKTEEELENLKKRLPVWVSNQLFKQKGRLIVNGSKGESNEMTLEEILESYESVDIVPTDFLHYLPFSAMLADVIKQVSIYPSLLSWKVLNERKPELKEEEPRNKVLVLQHTEQAFKAEVEALEKIIQGNNDDVEVLKLYSDYTQEEVIKRLKRGDFNVLHVTSHATLDREYPEKSYISLGGTRKLTIEALYENNIDLSGCDLIYLNSCEGGVGSIDSYDNGLSLQSAFLGLGAPTVIGNVFKAQQQEATELAKMFYTQWLIGNVGVSQALGNAYQDLLSSSNNELVRNTGFNVFGIGERQCSTQN